ncbi:MAG: DUF4430 domain-containing protein [bacterium]
MKIFLKQHRVHLVALTILVLILCISAGYLWFNPEQSKTLTPEQQLQIEKAKLIPKINKLVQTIPAPPSTTESFPIVSPLKTITKKEIKQSFSLDLYVQDQKYQINIATGTSVYEAMELLQKQTDFEFIGKDYSSMGFFVQEINGIKNDQKQGKYWIYYINGESAKVGISNYIIKQGDVIKWKYEESKF